MATLTDTSIRAERYTPAGDAGGADAAESLSSLDGYGRFARRHLALISAFTALGGLLGGVWAWQQPTTYSASASVVLAPAPAYVSASTAQSRPPEVTIDTDAQLIASEAVLETVAAAADEDAQTALDRLVVTATPLSRVLHIRYTDETAVGAAAAATAAAESLVEVRRTTLAALGADQAELLGLRARELQDRLTSRRRPIEVLPRDDLLSEIDLLRTRLGELERLRAAPAFVSQRATPPAAADSVDAEVPITSGSLLGFLLGCAIGAKRDRQSARMA